MTDCSAFSFIFSTSLQQYVSCFGYLIPPPPPVMVIALHILLTDLMNAPVSQVVTPPFTFMTEAVLCVQVCVVLC